MNTTLVLDFLRNIAEHNNRPWFQEHKAQYQAARKDFEAGVQLAINRITEFDDEIAHITVADSVYRFYRDTRFSPDKSPYKRHFGAYICSRGRKSLRGGYYLHLEPGHCLIAVGCYWLPTNILTACRNEIMGNTEQWLAAVENPTFIESFGRVGQGSWDGSERGFGLSQLKTCPAGFPRDYEHIEYLRMKDYCCWHAVPDNFFEGDGWIDPMSDLLQSAKPMMDFINSVVDDYE